MSAANTIQVVCGCGKQLSAPASAVGKKGRCPACGNTLYLTANDPAQMPAGAATRGTAQPVQRQIPDDSYDVVDNPKSPPPRAQGIPCPQCSTPMADGSVLCTNCGYNTLTGQAMAGAAPAAAAPPTTLSPLDQARRRAKAKTVDYMAPQKPFYRGVIMSAIFALVASSLWFVIAWATGYSIGIVAIVVGAAAGAGMKVGQEGYSKNGGVAAAGMTLAAIMFAKLALLMLLVHKINPNASVFDLDGAVLGAYFLRPLGLIIIAVGMSAAFRTASGGVSG